MKVSVSLPDEDVAFLDTYASAERMGSRSAVVHKAVRLLRGITLGAAYEEAFASWDDSGDAVDWDVTAADDA